MATLRFPFTEQAANLAYQERGGRLALAMAARDVPEICAAARALIHAHPPKTPQEHTTLTRLLDIAVGVLDAPGQIVVLAHIAAHAQEKSDRTDNNSRGHLAHLRTNAWRRMQDTVSRLVARDPQSTLRILARLLCDDGISTIRSGLLAVHDEAVMTIVSPSAALAPDVPKAP